MLQNIKVDIIYYQTSTDFEMEFNLCGCCRMRLLTEKASDRKELVHYLARAVSRSRVIIACGPLFDENGLISNVAKAIGQPLAVADNKAFGIKDSSAINIIKNSMPLVSPDGIFCGCIIESGPQAIILLTESKSIRKQVMQSLIHPYIEELSLIPAKSSSDAPTSIALDNLEKTELKATENSEEAEEDTEVQEEALANEEDEEDEDLEDMQPSEEEEAEEPTDEEIESDTGAEAESNAINEEDESLEEPVLEADETDEETQKSEEPELPEDDSGAPEEIEMYIEPQQVKRSKKSYYEIDYSAEDNPLYLIENNDQNSYEPKPNRFKVPILICAVVLLLALATLAYLLIFIPMSEGYGYSEYIQKIFSASEVAIRFFNPL